MMRRLSYLLTLTAMTVALILESCSGGNGESFVIRGNVRGENTDGTLVFLKYRDTTGAIQVRDSVKLQSNAFEFKGTADDEGLNFIQIDGMQGGVLVFLEPGTLKASFHKDSLNFADLKGTDQNELLTLYLTNQRDMVKAKEGIQDDWRKAVQSQDTVAMGSLRTEFDELIKKEAQGQRTFMIEHPDARVSAYILGDLLNQQILTNQEILEAYDALSPEVKESLQAKRMKEILDQRLKTDIGSVAPAISGPNPEGQTVSLNELKGQLVLVDFWAGWCKPCRQENPNIVNVYSKYKDKGFTVLGVSLDNDAELWKSAIQADGLSWSHVSNLQGFQDPLAVEYEVRAIPASFLIDGEGVIVAKNLRGPALESKVAELLGTAN